MISKDFDHFIGPVHLWLWPVVTIMKSAQAVILQEMGGAIKEPWQSWMATALWSASPSFFWWVEVLISPNSDQRRIWALNKPSSGVWPICPWLTSALISGDPDQPHLWSFWPWSLIIPAVTGPWLWWILTLISDQPRHWSLYWTPAVKPCSIFLCWRLPPS